jgi:hypothetical protein
MHDRHQKYSGNISKKQGDLHFTFEHQEESKPSQGDFFD